MTIIPRDYESLTVAFNRLGEEMYPDKWTGRELTDYPGDARARRETVEEEFCQRGYLEDITGYYVLSNGTIEPVPKKWWMAEDTQFDFVLGKVTRPSRAIVGGRGNTYAVWIKKQQGLTAHKASAVGRPTLSPKIEEAYRELRKEEKIDFDQPKARIYDPIRENVKLKTGQKNNKNLGDEAIRKVISDLFDRDSEVRIKP